MLVFRKNLFLLVIFFSLTFPTHAPAGQGDLISARIGMEVVSQGAVRQAKSRDRIRSGDELRILVVPEQDSHVYAIYSNSKTAQLINRDQAHQKVISNSLKVFPSTKELYQSDGLDPNEMFTVICSPDPIEDIIKLFDNGETSQTEWLELRNRLSAKNNLGMSERVEKNISTGGTVRGHGLESDSEFDISSIRISSGKSIVSKHYRFHVQK